MADDEMICCICKISLESENWDGCDQGFICESCKAKCPPHCQPCPLKKA